MVFLKINNNNVHNIEEGYDEDLEHIVYSVTLFVNAPFSTAQINISKDLSMRYVAESETLPKKIIETTSISQEQFNALARLLHKNNYWSQSYENGTRLLVDLSIYSLNVASLPAGVDPYNADLGVYEVACFDSCPKEIQEIMDAVEKLLGKEILDVGV